MDNELIKRLKKRWEESTAERTRSAVLDRMDQGSWRDLVQGTKKEPAHHSDPRYRPKIAPRLLGHLLDQLSYLYSVEPSRVVKDRQWAEAKLWRFRTGLSATLAAADRKSRLHGAALVLLQYRTDPWSPVVEEGSDRALDGVEAVLVERANWCAIAHDDDSRQPQAVAIKMGEIKDSRGGVKEVHHLYDDEHLVKTIGWETVETIELNYGVSPAMVVRSTLTDLALTPPGLGGEDLIENLCALGRVLREFTWAALLQRGQWVIKGEIVGSLTLTPDSAIRLKGEGADAKAVKNNADLTGMLQALKYQLDLFCKTMGLPSTTFRLSSDARSGVSIAMERVELHDDRRDREKICAGWERDAHRRASRIYGAERGRVVDGALESVAYHEAPMPLSPDEHLRRLAFEREQGVLSDVDLLRELHPTISADEIAARLARAHDPKLQPLATKLDYARHLVGLGMPAKQINDQLDLGWEPWAGWETPRVTVVGARFAPQTIDIEEEAKRADIEAKREKSATVPPGPVTSRGEEGPGDPPPQPEERPDERQAR